MARVNGDQVTALSVQVVETGGVPEPDPTRRDRWAGFVPLVAVLIVAAFGAGFLLARSGREFAPSIIEDGSTTQPTTATTAATTTTTVVGDEERLADRWGGWDRAPLAAPVAGIESYAIDGGQVDDVAVDAAGRAWWVTGTGVGRWNPTEDTTEVFGEEVFGYTPPFEVEAGPDGPVWVATPRSVFCFDGEWTRFPSPDPDEYVIAIQPLPEGNVAVLTIPPGSGGLRLYRSAAGDLRGAVLFELPIPDVYRMAADRAGRLWFFGGDIERSFSTWIMNGTSLTSGPPLPAGSLVDDVAVGDDLWVGTAGNPGALLHLVNDAWTRVSLPAANPPETAPHQWVLASRAAGGVWAVSVTADGTAVQAFEVDGTSTVAHPPYQTPNASVWSAAVAPDGRLWIGTGSGLVGFDPVTGEWEEITGGSGPPGLVGSIGSMAIDGNGTLWTAAGWWNNAETRLVRSFDGGQWNEAAGIGSCPVDEGCWGEIVAGPAGDLWAYVVIGGERALWHRSGDVWLHKRLPDSGFEGGDPAMAVGTDGTLWMVDSRSTASFDGDAWTVWDDGVVNDGSLVVGRDGTPWIIDTAGSIRVMRFFEGVWAPVEPALPAEGWGFLGQCPDGGIGVAVVGGEWATTGRVWSFDGTAWRLEFEADGWIAGIAPGPGQTAWVAGSDLWLVGEGPPRLIARGIEAWLTAGAPDGSLWVLGGGNGILYHVHPPD